VGQTAQQILGRLKALLSTGEQGRHRRLGINQENVGIDRIVGLREKCDMVELNKLWSHFNQLASQKEGGNLCAGMQDRLLGPGRPEDLPRTTAITLSAGAEPISVLKKLKSNIQAYARTLIQRRAL
jgi:hypothetical protein